MKQFIPYLFALSSTIATAASSESAPAQKDVLNDWFALGSGCRAKHDLPGNVRMERLPQDPSRPNVHRMKFSIENFALNEKTSPLSTIKFARECAIRVNINPPANKKFVNLIAETSLTMDKAKGNALDSVIALKLGSSLLSEKVQMLTTNEVAKTTDEQVVLFPGKGSEEKFPELACGEAKILGVDYSFIATRASSSVQAPVSISLGRDRSLIIEATLADCAT